MTDYSPLSGDEGWKAREAAREEALATRQAAYLALPAIKRIELWYETTCDCVPVGEALRQLGGALSEWAKEQQK